MPSTTIVNDVVGLKVVTKDGKSYQYGSCESLILVGLIGAAVDQPAHEVPAAKPEAAKPAAKPAPKAEPEAEEKPAAKKKGRKFPGKKPADQDPDFISLADAKVSPDDWGKISKGEGRDGLLVRRRNNNNPRWCDYELLGISMETSGEVKASLTAKWMEKPQRCELDRAFVVLADLLERIS